MRIYMRTGKTWSADTPGNGGACLLCFHLVGALGFCNYTVTHWPSPTGGRAEGEMGTPSERLFDTDLTGAGTWAKR